MRERNLGEIKIQIDKMGGLNLGNLNLCPWDMIAHDIRLRVSNTQGYSQEVGMLQVEEIDTLFPRFGNSGVPKLYRLRPGKLGKPKTKGFVRLIADNENYGNLVQADAGGIKKKELVSGIPIQSELSLEVFKNINNSVSSIGSILLFSPNNVTNRLERLK